MPYVYKTVITEKERERRRVYQRAYQKTHREQYNAYRRKAKGQFRANSGGQTYCWKSSAIKWMRPVIKETYLRSDLMRLPQEKVLRAFEYIIKGERGLTV